MTQILPGIEAGNLVGEAGIGAGNEAAERAASGNLSNSPWIPGYYISMEREFDEDHFGITGVSFFVGFYS